MAAEDDLPSQYLGHTVPQRYNATFIALSFLVSLIGASSTLELVNRRTGFKGLFNHSAVTMGGVSIWCMHFIGNQAVELAHGEPRLQIAYSASFTALSFFVPILVLAAAFVAVGSAEHVSWWRISAGGTLCGGAVCGMHYLGNASIANYTCFYQTPNVVGAAIISVAASTAALSIFFIFRSIWANSWWKRIASGLLLGAAVSGMHWVAAVGTRYQLKTADHVESNVSRRSTVIVVICLSVAACFIIAGSVILKARNFKKYADKAQKVTLGAAIFDRQGRILVDTDGLMPSTIITDLYPEKHNEEFGIAHPAFHWMFQATNNWAPIANLLPSIKSHLAQLPVSGPAEGGRPRVALTNSLGDRIENHNTVFRELFCVAAASLAERLREQITSAGVLWDEILPTGVSGKDNDVLGRAAAKNGHVSVSVEEAADASEKGQLGSRQVYGHGSLMFLVRHVHSSSEVDKLTSLGYRFAQVHHVAGVIHSRMQIQSPGTDSKLRQMAAYAQQDESPREDVRLCYFGVRARPGKSGFEVAVQKGARGELPSSTLPVDKLEPWQLDCLRLYENRPVSALLSALDGSESGNVAPGAKAFAGVVSDAIKALKSSVQCHFFDDAMLTLKVLGFPGREGGSSGGAQLLAFRILLPVHAVLGGSACEFIPLSFFQVRQNFQRQQLDFTRSVHGELRPVLQQALGPDAGRGHGDTRGARHSRRLWWDRRPGTGSEATLKVYQKPDRRSSSAIASVHSGSTVELYPHHSNSGPVPQLPSAAELTGQSPRNLHNGIFVSQEITIDVEAAEGEDRTGGKHSDQQTTWSLGRSLFHKALPKPPPTPDVEMNAMGQVRTNIHAETTGGEGGEGSAPTFAATYIDVLFEQCVEGRQG